MSLDKLLLNNLDDVKHLRPYHPTPHLLIRKIFRHRLLQDKNKILVDMGCGAGRVLYYASKYGFNEIHGVELSLSALKICKRNVKSSKVQLHHCSGQAFNFPPRTRILFMFNPFDEHLLLQMLLRMQECGVSPKGLTIVYVNPLTVRQKILLENGFRRIDYWESFDHNSDVAFFQGV